MSEQNLTSPNADATSNWVPGSPADKAMVPDFLGPAGLLILGATFGGWGLLRLTAIDNGIPMPLAIILAVAGVVLLIAALRFNQSAWKRYLKRNRLVRRYEFRLTSIMPALYGGIAVHFSSPCENTRTVTLEPDQIRFVEMTDGDDSETVCLPSAQYDAWGRLDPGDTATVRARSEQFGWVLDAQ